MVSTSLASPAGDRQRDWSGGGKESGSGRREKGLWSFLTWSFFLSQVVAAEHAAAGSAQSAGADDKAQTSDTTAGQAAQKSFLPLDPVATPETPEDAQRVLTQAAALEAGPHAVAPKALGEGAASVAHGSPDDDLPAGHHATAAAFAVDSESAGPDAGEGSATLESVVDPLVDVVGGVVGGVVDLLDPLVDGVAPVLGGVIDLLDPVVDGVVAPLLGNVQQIAAPVLGLVDDIAGDLLEPVTQAAAPVLGLVNDLTGDLLGDGPLSALLGLGSETAESISTAPIAAGSSSLDFQQAPAAAASLLDELFSGGRYTDYNLALQADAPAGPLSMPGSILTDAVATADDIVSAITGTSLSDGVNGQAHHGGLLSGGHGDIGLHGLGL